MMKKSVTILLLAAIFLAACTQTGDTDTPADDADASAVDTMANTETAPETDAPKYDFGGRDYTILCRTDCAYEFVSADGAADLVSDAVIKRNYGVEESCNVKLKPVDIPGTWADKDSFMNTITASVLAGDDTYQLIAGYNAYITTLVTQDCLYNLYDTAMDFTKPWWYAGYNDNVSLFGKLYFALGDASLTMWENCEVVFFNKNLMENYDLTSPYTLVDEDKWDFDTLRAYANTVSADVNNDSTWDETDTWGMLLYNKRDFPVYFENPFCKKDENGKPYISLFSEGLTNMYEKVYRFYQVEHGAHQFQPDVNQQIFSEDRALLYQAPLRYAALFRDNESDFGIVPFPKCNPGQSRYYTTVLDKTSVFSIPASAQEPAFCAAVLDELCRQSADTVVPRYYEQTLKDKYSRDPETAGMLDIVRDSIWFDCGFVYSVSLNYLGAFLDVLDSDTQGVASAYAEKEQSYQAALDNLISHLE
ncbi:MAG: extracellular solute-binding protein [Eubacteriales bacterium]|nr:extracellular solute-binding protein [Eubacteriales bacterium]